MQWEWEQYQWAWQWHEWQLKQREWQMGVRQKYLEREAARVEMKKRLSITAAGEDAPAAGLAVPGAAGTIGGGGLQTSGGVNVKRPRVYRPSPLSRAVSISSNHSGEESVRTRSSLLPDRFGSLARSLSTSSHGPPGSARPRSVMSTTSTDSSRSFLVTSPEWAAPSDLVRSPSRSSGVTARSSGDYGGATHVGRRSVMLDHGVMASSFTVENGDVSVVEITSGGVTTQMVQAEAEASLEPEVGDDESEDEGGAVESRYVVRLSHRPEGRFEGELELEIGERVVVWKVGTDG
ncbi:hypothetical protein HK101_007064, partial [Irineochytrium annulatum]